MMVINWKRKLRTQRKSKFLKEGGGDLSHFQLKSHAVEERTQERTYPRKYKGTQREDILTLFLILLRV